MVWGLKSESESGSTRLCEVCGMPESKKRLTWGGADGFDLGHGARRGPRFN